MEGSISSGRFPYFMLQQANMEDNVFVAAERWEWLSRRLTADHESQSKHAVTWFCSLAADWVLRGGASVSQQPQQIEEQIGAYVLC